MQSIYVYYEAIETKGRSVEEVYYFYLFIMFKSVLGFDVVRDRIVAPTRGKVPQQHATVVQCPHRIF